MTHRRKCSNLRLDTYIKTEARRRQLSNATSYVCRYANLRKMRTKIYNRVIELSISTKRSMAYLRGTGMSTIFGSGYWAASTARKTRYFRGRYCRGVAAINPAEYRSILTARYDIQNGQSQFPSVKTRRWNVGDMRSDQDRSATGITDSVSLRMNKAVKVGKNCEKRLKTSQSGKIC